MSRPRHENQLRRVVLPSGKTIEVVYYEEHPELAGPPTARPQTAEHAAEMHVCGTCASGLVYPTKWSEAGALHWKVTLRCPNCEWSGTGVFSQAEVERFDDHLDRGTEQLVFDMQQLSVANMEDEVARFAAALAAGVILPEDF